ncbi:MAG: hypothetical protein WD030_01285 [Pirellulales bacterium]
MISEHTKSVVERAKAIYFERLQTTLEAEHPDRYVAVEPESGDYFLGDTIDEAVKSARTKYPTRLSHILRIGHRAALRLEQIHLK